MTIENERPEGSPQRRSVAESNQDHKPTEYNEMKHRIQLPNDVILPTPGSSDRPIKSRRYRSMVKTLNKLLNENAHRRANKSKDSHVGKKTQHNRRVILNAQFRTLHELGYHLEDVYHFKTKHEKILKEHWVRKRCQPHTMRFYVSVMHVFAGWINKPWLFKDPAAFLPDRSFIARTYAADPEKFQAGVGSADLSKMLREATELDERYGCILSLCMFWALRVEEALLFHPHTANDGKMMKVFYGTKGGNPRVLHEMLTQKQYEVLEWAKTLVPTAHESMITATLSYEEYHTRFRTLCRKFGLTKKGRWGFTPQALRQLKFVEIYKTVTGALPPVAGGTAEDVTRERDLAGRKAVAEYAGHRRIAVSTAYIGAIVTKPERPAVDCDVE